jgi:hypothetical protein
LSTIGQSSSPSRSSKKVSRLVKDEGRQRGQAAILRCVAG